MYPSFGLLTPFKKKEYIENIYLLEGAGRGSVKSLP